MLTFVKAHVWKYKSIEDSTPVVIDDRVTVLVGKNEAGKTCFLEALYKALPLNDKDAAFEVVFDYPRKDYIRYKAQHDAKQYAKVVELTFRINADSADKINTDVFGGIQVIRSGTICTRSVNYNNEASTGFSIDESAALAAFKKQLSCAEHLDEVFDGMNTFAEVLKKIESLTLSADNKLSRFAKQWREWTKDAVSDLGLVNGHVWKQYLAPTIPKFLYFNDYRILQGKINLPALSQRKTQSKCNESDETVLGLFDLAGVTIDELNSESGYEDSKAKLEAIGLNITQQVFEYWKQNTELSVEFDIKADPRDQPPFNNGRNLYIRIKNGRHGVSLPFDQHSKGFIWFFSFMAWFSAISNRVGTRAPLTLLLDEPGLNLHALAQADFLHYIHDLSQKHQIIYTTHSPFMVESGHLENVRVVEDRPKDGTKVTADLEGSGEDSLFPLQAALGYSIAQNLFIAKNNILVEGPADFLLLHHMSLLLETSGGEGLKDAILVPVGGLDKLATFVALLGANDLNLVVLHDHAGAPHQKLEDLVRQKLIERKRVFDYSMFRGTPNQPTDIEDLFPPVLYLDAFNATYANELKGRTVTVTDLPERPRIIERLDAWLEQERIKLLKAGGFNHYRVAQALLPRLTTEKLDAATRSNFKDLFAKLNEVSA
jgi:predicted ATPase